MAWILITTRRSGITEEVFYALHQGIVTTLNESLYIEENNNPPPEGCSDKALGVAVQPLGVLR